MREKDIYLRLKFHFEKRKRPQGMKRRRSRQLLNSFAINHDQVEIGRIKICSEFGSKFISEIGTEISSEILPEICSENFENF